MNVTKSYKAMGDELRQMPLVKLIIPFIFGIIVQIKLGWGIPVLLFLIIFILVSIIVLSSLKIFSNYRFRWLFGPMVFLVLFMAGAEMVSIKKQGLETKEYADENGIIVATVIEAPVDKEKSVKAVVQVEGLKNGNEWYASEGKAIVYLEKDNNSQSLEYGDRIMFEPLLDDVKNAGNPNEFDYKQYLAFHMISRQAYLKSGNWKRMGQKGGNWIMLMADKFRNKLLSIYKKNGLEGDEFAVAAALTLGYKDSLDEKLRRSYSSSGALHVLAVSGLHVGVIYIVMNSLLFFLNRNKWSRILKAILIVVLLWFYALITGLSPSVMRAACMFSFVLIGSTLNRSTNIYNTLAASAFLLLLINPYLITELGFQLSYLAVGGIVFFQPRIYKLLTVKNRLLDKVWGLTSVSIAAQIATLPIGLFYFHQFPNYFLVTNLVVIPFATILIYFATALLIFSFVEPVAIILGKVLSVMVYCLNYFVSFIEKLPYAVAEGINLSFAQCIMLYVFIISISVWLIDKNVAWLKASLFVVIIFLGISGYESYNRQLQRKFIVYNINSVAAYNFIAGEENIFFSNISMRENRSKLMYNVENNWLSLGLDQEKFISLDKLNSRFLISNLITLDNSNICYKSNYISFYGKRILLVDSNYRLPKSRKKKMALDYIILTDNAKISIGAILEYYEVGQIIIDSSNSRWKAEKWSSESGKYEVRCHSVDSDGAFEADV